jgi:hypothetical protein
MPINRLLLFQFLFCVQKYIFCDNGATDLLQIDLIGILNCNTFSVVPSIINENAKNALFHHS